jgi:hypothetical protein
MKRLESNQRVLQRAFRDVRKNIFSRWDLKNEWTVKKVKHLPISAPVIAYTNHSLKTIFVNYLPNNKNSLYSLLIHEICHAVTSGQHHKRWEERMVKSADKASKTGNIHLTELIYEDLDNVKRAYLEI